MISVKDGIAKLFSAKVSVKSPVVVDEVSVKGKSVEPIVVVSVVVAIKSPVVVDAILVKDKSVESIVVVTVKIAVRSSVLVEEFSIVDSSALLHSSVLEFKS